jgi:hypothetical protein
MKRMKRMKITKIQKKSYSAFSPLPVLHALHGRKKGVRLVGSQPGDNQRKIPLMPGVLVVLPQAGRAASSQSAPLFPLPLR